MAEWFEGWFGEAYLEMYPHRDETDAARAVELIANTVPLCGKKVLDLACGPGRHSDLLRSYRTSVVGLDLSEPLLRRARGNYSPPISVVRGDMRALPFAPASFDVVVNLFTSFGYFDSDAQHDAVLHGVAQTLGLNGWFVLDYLNAFRVRDTLVAYEEVAVGVKQVAVTRWISDDGKYVYKNMRLIEEGDSYQERVRLFEPDELETFLAAAGFSVRERFGGYTGGPLDSYSPRALFFSVCK